MHSLIQDLRYALRSLGRSPGFTAVAIVTLGLGIGANTAIFSVVSALVLRSLPYRQPERLVLLENTHPHRDYTSVGKDNFLDWQAQNTVFEAMAYTAFSQVNFTGQSFPGFGEPERLTGLEVTAGFFPLLGVQPLLGRWLLPEEQTPDRNQVIVLSYGLWLRRFGAKADILGGKLMLSGRSHTIVGIMPESFRFNEGRVCEYWTPLEHSASGRQQHQYSAYARLKPGIPVATAQTQMSAIARRLEQAYADNTGWSIRVTRIYDSLISQLGPAIAIFSAAVGMVLLIACANVANLLLARSTSRTREIAIRRALGAGRLRILRLLLTESLLVSLGGAALGLLLAWWSMDLAIAAAPAWLALKSILYLDRGVLAFTLLLSVLTGVLTGLAPALQATRVGVNEHLKQGGSAIGTSFQHARTLSTLVVSEVALAVLLLVAAGLTTKSFVRLLSVNLGFRTNDVLTLRLQLPWSKYREDYQVEQFYRHLVERVRDLPGVISAGAISAIPLGGQYSGGPIEIEGRPVPRDWTEMSAAYHEATPDYLRTLGIPLQKGRHFTDQDRTGSPPVVIVNEALVRKFFPREDPIGKHIRLGGENTWRIVVGITGDVRHNGPEDGPEPETYTPQAQDPSSHMYLAVHTATGSSGLAGAVRAEVRALDRDLPVTDVRTMDQAVSQSLALRRQVMAMMVFFGGLALLLAAIGLAGVMWYSVSRRTHEIGVRMAFGADRGDVLRLVLARGLGLTLAGVSLGLGGAFAVTRLLASLLYGVSPRDLGVFLLVPLVLLFVALAASYIPARRAANVDPMAALHHE